jgi:transposase-like protein
MGNRASEEKREYAELLFMKGIQNKEIAEKVGVSANTIGRWVEDGNWAEKRAAQTITRKELVNNLLRSIDALASKLGEVDDISKVGNISDQLSKLASVVEKLDKGVSVVDFIDCFIAFGKWLEYQSANDPELTAEFRKKVNEYQNRYVSELLAGKMDK